MLYVVAELRGRLVGEWRRVYPERVAAIEGELAEVRGEVMAARNAAESEVEAELVADWQRRLRRLLQVDPAWLASCGDCWTMS